MLNIYKGKNSNLTVKNLASTILNNQNFTSPVMGQTDIVCLFMMLRTQHPFCGITAKNAQPESNHEEHQMSKCPRGHSTKITGCTL